MEKRDIDWRNMILSIGKFLAYVATLITCLIIYDDWYSQRVRVEMFPTNISIDSSLVNMTPFELESDEKNVAIIANSLDEEGLFDRILFRYEMAPILGGDVADISKYNIHSFDYAIACIEKMMESDSIASARKATPPIIDKKINRPEQEVKTLLERLKSIRQKYFDQFKDNIRLSIRIKLLNKSSSQTALIKPALLRVNYEEREQDFRLVLFASRSEMKMFGFEMSMGPARTAIQGHSHEEFTFVTKSREELGDSWEFLNKALTGTNAKAAIIFYTIDGAIRESSQFPFSIDYADKVTDDRYKALERY